MAINWDYWLKRRAIHEIEISLLTLGLDPESYPINSLAGEQWVDERDLNEKKKEFDMRRNLILDYRFKPYEYMANDGEWGDYFADGYNNKILVKRFLLWLKNENLGLVLPPELMTSIQELNNTSKKGAELLPRKNIPIQAQQDKNVLDAIKILGQKPLALPPQTKQGTRTFKADVRDYCISNYNFTSDTFDNTWKRLKENNKIKSGS